MALAGVRVSKSSSRAKFRRSPFLISYWYGPALVFENYATRRKVAGDPFVTRLVDFCGQGRTLDQLIKKFPEHGSRALHAGVQQLLKHSLLERCEKRSKSQDRKWKDWVFWNPAAAFLHFSTKDTKFEASGQDDVRGPRESARHQPLPSRVKKYHSVPTLKLERGNGEAEYPRILTARRTWREFSSEPVGRRELEQLLWLSFGVQGWAKIAGLGRLALKTSPSGGALHPLEPYIWIRNVRGIATGIYHYDAAGHRLELLRKGASKREMTTFLAGQSWSSEAAFVVFLSAVFSRSQWKYKHPRAYRVVLAEAGHFCQTFCLTATWLGLAPFCTMALADTKIEKALGIDGITESVLYAMGAGMKPSREATAERLRMKKRTRG